MGSKGNAFENAFLLLIFNNDDTADPIASLGDATGIGKSTADGSVWARLYTSAVATDDSTIGTECAYTGYVSGGIAVARTTGGWTVSTNNATNAAAITYGACTAGSETVRYVALWVDNSTGTEDHRLFWGQLTSDLAVSSGITPEFAAGDFDVNED
jgi:hypothetical protein